VKARHKRIILIFLSAGLLTLGSVIVVNVFRENLVFFYSPSELVSGKIPILNRELRLGGMVVPESVKRDQQDTKVSFIVTDNEHSVEVIYSGILPDLFREGKGVVVQGKFGSEGNLFRATQVLAKHDENYMPPEVAEMMEKKNQTK
tara:strand:+ start:163 stop:600 length:438 start_codon:yes stop_codon:yes gene_type:complete